MFAPVSAPVTAPVAARASAPVSAPVTGTAPVADAPAFFKDAPVGAARPAMIEERMLRDAGDVERLADALRARLEPGKRIRVRFEILDGEEK